MMLVTIVLVLVAELDYQSRLEGLAAANVSDLDAIEYAIDGEFEVALALLKYDKKQGEGTDSEGEIWNDDRYRRRSEGDVALTMRMFDEQGKFNLTRLVTGNDAQQKKARDYLVRLLQIYREDLSDPPEKGGAIDVGMAQDVADKIVKYMKREGAQGQIPKPKSSPANVPLLLDEIVFADTKLLPTLLRDMRVGEKIAPGLHRYVTVHGTGRINVNTAPLAVLKALFSVETDRDYAQRIIDRRRSEPDATSRGSSRPSSTTPTSTASGNPFTDANTQLTDGSVEGLTQEVLQKNAIVTAEDLDVKSDVFGVRIQGVTDRTQRDEFYVVERVKTDGFRFLLHQERTDPLLDTPDDANTIEPTSR